MHLGIKTLVPAPFVLLLALTGCNSKAPDAKSSTPPKVTVAKPIVEDGMIDHDEYNGWLVAKDPVEVRSRVRGFVKEIHFKDPPKGKPGEGELVKKGDPLFDLDPDPFQDEIAQA